MRGKVDPVLALPWPTGRPSSWPAGSRPSTLAIERATQLRLTAEIVAEAPEARLIRLMQMRHLVSQMAEYAGRERAAMPGFSRPTSH